MVEWNIFKQHDSWIRNHWLCFFNLYDEKAAALKRRLNMLCCTVDSRRFMNHNNQLVWIMETQCLHFQFVFTYPPYFEQISLLLSCDENSCERQYVSVTRVYTGENLTRFVLIRLRDATFSVMETSESVLLKALYKLAQATIMVIDLLHLGYLLFNKLSQEHNIEKI